jgi:hypothetical protein
VSALVLRSTNVQGLLCVSVLGFCAKALAVFLCEQASVVVGWLCDNVLVLLPKYELVLHR